MVLVEINAKAETKIHPNKGPGTWQWGGGGVLLG